MFILCSILATGHLHGLCINVLSSNRSILPFLKHGGSAKLLISKYSRGLINKTTTYAYLIAPSKLDCNQPTSEETKNI